MGCQGCSFAGQSTALEETFVGVRFAEETNLTLCRTSGELFRRGDDVVVSLESGPAFGRVEKSPMPVFKPCQKSSARELRHAATQDRSHSFVETSSSLRLEIPMRAAFMKYVNPQI